MNEIFQVGGRGRRPRATPEILSVAPLAPEDLAELRSPAPRRVAKLRDSHHNVARLLAAGLSYGEVAERSGYSLGRIVQLAADPSMQELVAQYRGMVDETWRAEMDFVVEESLRNLRKATRQVGEALDTADETGEPLPVRSLMAIISDAADRFGYGKRSTQVNVNLDFASRLEAAIAARRSLRHENSDEAI